MDATIKALIEQDVKIKRQYDRIERAMEKHIAPLEQELEKIGEKANELWRKVLEEYGPGQAQEELRKAREALFNEALDSCKD